MRCYSANRRSSNPMQLHFCNFTGKIESELAKNNGYKNWDVRKITSFFTSLPYIFFH